MSYDDTALQAVRAWLKAYAPATGALTDAQVILAYGKGKPVKPFLAVETLAVLSVGQDERIETATGWKTRGLKSATVSIHGYGVESLDWIERALLRLYEPPAQIAIDALKVTIERRGDIQRVPELVADAYEIRYVQDVEVRFALDTTSTTAVEFAHAEVAVTYDSSVVADFTQTITTTE